MRKAILLVGSSVGLAMLLIMMMTTMAFVLPGSTAIMGAQLSQPVGAADHHAEDSQYPRACGSSSLGCHRAL